MGKSIRSKWKRKCRAIKRERYAVKELAQLKKTLGIKEEGKINESEVMESDQVIYLDGEKLTKRGKKKAPVELEDEEMSSDDENVVIAGEEGKVRSFSTKTLKDQNGQYPVWLHKRKIAKLNKSNQKMKTKKRSKRRK